MRQASDRSYYFYNIKLTSLKQGSQTRHAFRFQELPLAEQHVQGDGAIRLLASDSQKTVLSVLGDERQSHAFTAYGHDVSQLRGHGILGFNGEHFNRHSGSYVLGNGYRAYSPVLMRFRSSDSWSPFASGGLNSYAYCSDDPVNNLDPSGHAPLSRGGHVNRRVVETYWIEHYETLKVTRIKTVGNGKRAQSQTVVDIRRTLNTTEVNKVRVNPLIGEETTYVTSRNLDNYLEATNELNALTLASKMGDSRVTGSSAYLSNLESYSQGLTRRGRSLVKRAEDPSDLSAYWQGTFRVSEGASGIRNTGFRPVRN
ncbi:MULTISPECIES: RHS repeat-associated core domain-containing protein [Pseudomonas]|uniref:RHS repeat-associated core domain-containing protein n=1 Tax=Pseudomonas juntendi TaxID=2666183 RepID=A0A7W2QVH6_9PSED|nr:MULTISPECIES: RHS repeat-associated core domain-containing protein [Pseudomonas]NOY04120.1 RHS repeat-associated core domain-containing protein [Gammaproteobacteria bacterium]OAK64388.1 hypothetical protein A3K88_09880 [Pseudomonas putida]PPB13716.1 RHS repeat-associated core domain-containing protein [Pseudomonas aeruginosa]MBA6143830.1 RHS repeat-associated core domain-containing protein [Pseudomonas juntendi]MCL8328874.1 RHS repeat-associated core domain-containing protein [Pseudomonas j